MLQVLGVAKADARYCGDPNEVLPSLAQFTTWAADHLLVVAVDSATLLVWIAFLIRKTDKGDAAEIRRFAVRFGATATLDAIRPATRFAAQTLLGMGITYCYSYLYPTANITFATSSSLGTPRYLGVDTLTGQPSTCVMDIDVAKVAK
jgi:hypothetical protein